MLNYTNNDGDSCQTQIEESEIENNYLYHGTEVIGVELDATEYEELASLTKTFFEY